MSDLCRRIDAIVDQAMSTGDWTLFDAYRAVFAADDHPMNLNLLSRLDLGRESARCMRGLSRMAALAERTGDAETKADFLAMANAIKVRYEAVTAASRAARESLKGIRTRWENATNAVVYADAITKAKNLMAMGHDRQHILEIVGREKCVKGLKSAQITRILRENKALPAARK